MNTKLNQLKNSLKEAQNLISELNNPEYWINRAKEEAGFIPQEGDWILIDVTLYKIQINIYPKFFKPGTSAHWINGQWFTTAFPINYPNL
jgi:hypothetical protein